MSFDVTEAWTQVFIDLILEESSASGIDMSDETERATVTMALQQTIDFLNGDDWESE